MYVKQDMSTIETEHRKSKIKYKGMSTRNLHLSILNKYPQNIFYLTNYTLILKKNLK
jgi:hypothetical protein